MFGPMGGIGLVFFIWLQSWDSYVLCAHTHTHAHMRVRTVGLGGSRLHFVQRLIGNIGIHVLTRPCLKHSHLCACMESRWTVKKRQTPNTRVRKRTSGVKDAHPVTQTEYHTMLNGSAGKSDSALSVPHICHIKHDQIFAAHLCATSTIIGF